MIAVLAAVATVVYLSIDAVENQTRQITGIVTDTPSSLATSGTPLSGVRVEYVEDGADADSALVATTGQDGRFSFTAGGSGVVTASKSGLVRISVGWESGTSTLRIELMSPATLSGRAYDMSTRRSIPDAYVSAMVDHDVNPRAASTISGDGSFQFGGLPPGSSFVLVFADGYAPAIGTGTLTAGSSTTVDVGMVLEGAVSGTVVDSDGDAVSGALVDIEYDWFEDADILIGGVGGHVKTGDDGKFLVVGIVPNQRFSIFAETDDGSRSSSKSLTATSGNTTEDVVLTIG